MEHLFSVTYQVINITLLF